MYSNSFLVTSLGFSTYKIESFANRDSFSASFPLPCIFLICLILVFLLPPECKLLTAVTPVHRTGTGTWVMLTYLNECMELAWLGQVMPNPGLPLPLWHLLPEGSRPCLSGWGLSLLSPISSPALFRSPPVLGLQGLLEVTFLTRLEHSGD